MWLDIGGRRGQTLIDRIGEKKERKKEKAKVSCFWDGGGRGGEGKGSPHG